MVTNNPHRILQNGRDGIYAATLQFNTAVTREMQWKQQNGADIIYRAGSATATVGNLGE